jgi:uncharacterized membrane protein YsdA (DUF1294 family)
MCYLVAFGLIAAVLTGGAYAMLFANTTWHPYLTWLVAINGVTLVMYAIDRWIGRQDKVETPETVLHVLFAGGGFVGAWLGRAIFGYKVDLAANPWLQIILILTTIGHGFLIYRWLLSELSSLLAL